MTELPRYAVVARALALTMTACGGATTESPTTAHRATPQASASTSAKHASNEVLPPSEPQGDPTDGSGPCRCSWQPSTASAPRVCRPGEPDHVGNACVRGTRPKFDGMMLGPLPPPDLSADRSA